MGDLFSKLYFCNDKSLPDFPEHRPPPPPLDAQKLRGQHRPKFLNFKIFDFDKA